MAKLIVDIFYYNTCRFGNLCKRSQLMCLISTVMQFGTMANLVYVIC